MQTGGRVCVAHICAASDRTFKDYLTAGRAPQHLFPTLGRDITERQYGADCRLYISGQGINWPVIRDTMDEFVIAHTVCICHLHAGWRLAMACTVSQVIGQGLTSSRTVLRNTPMARRLDGWAVQQNGRALGACRKY